MPHLHDAVMTHKGVYIDGHGRELSKIIPA